MSRSLLHDWESDIERICGDKADEMLEIAKNIYDTGFARGKNSGMNKGEWIPVIERLPKDGELVLCSVADSNHSVIINCFENQSYWRNGKIYAWQPLPEPYKKEGE